MMLPSKKIVAIKRLIYEVIYDQMHNQTLYIANDISWGKQSKIIIGRKGLRYVLQKLNMFYKLSHLKNDADLCWYELHEH